VAGFIDIDNNSFQTKIEKKKPAIRLARPYGR
jgi:hypothetical protein